jgi:hypothetical protein
MVGGNVNPYPILLLINYWEIRPAHMGKRLDELLKRGITQFGTFVPWQAVESDISHTLTRFLQAVSERRMNVHIILSPEVGIHYPNSGLPKDVILRKENMAQHCKHGRVAVNLPPNSFSLPSLFSPELNKRYSSFLARMDGFFSDLAKSQPNLLKGVTTVLSGSFWKYYRSPQHSSLTAFGGSAGDYSTHAALAYRQRLEQHFGQREFLDPTPSSANRWKTRFMEDTNRRWFYQQSEDVFRNRSLQMIQKRSTALKLKEIELYTPEADPGVAYSNFLQMVSGGHADFSKLSSMIDEAASRSAFPCSLPVSSFIHWTSMGGFRMLSESEKQFLILKSLLMVGGQGGGVLIDESEWFTLSSNFRTRVDALARSFTQGDFQLRARAFYLVPHLWSNYGTLWEELQKKIGPGARMVSSIDAIMRENFSHLLMVDPSFILTREVIQKLVAWAKAGRLVVLPKTQLYTEAAKKELDSVLAQTKRMEVDLGLTYRLHALGDGKLVVYDVPDDFLMKGEPLSSWQGFLSAVLSIADVDNFCRLSDSRLCAIPFERNGEGLAVFVLNGTRRHVTADLIFPTQVAVGDLGVALSENENKPIEAETVAQANRFTLSVPPFGVLPLSVNGLNLVAVRERQTAAMTSEETLKNALNAAASELPGFNPDSNLEDIWS